MRIVSQVYLVAAVLGVLNSGLAAPYQADPIIARFHGQPTPNVSVRGLADNGIAGLDVYGPKGKAPGESETDDVLVTAHQFKRLVPPLMAGETLNSVFLIGMTSTGIRFGEFETQNGSAAPIVHGFVLSKGHWTRYDYPGAIYSGVDSVSAGGHYVSLYGFPSTLGTKLYHDGSEVMLDTSALPSGARVTYMRVADTGLQAGIYSYQNSEGRTQDASFTGSGGKLTTFDPVPSKQCTIYGSSDDGMTIVGSCLNPDFTADGLIYKQGQAEFITVAKAVVAVDSVNSAGDVAGVIEKFEPGPTTLFVKIASGQMTSIPLPDGPSLQEDLFVTAIDSSRNLTFESGYRSYYIHQ